MGSQIEIRKNPADTSSLAARIQLSADESFSLVLSPGTNGPLKEVGYEITNVADSGTVIQPLFPGPTEPGKLPQGSKPYILINNHMDLEGIMYQGENTPVTARIIDTQQPSLS